MPGFQASGFGHYLRDVVYGAVDGVVTTMAVVAGATGANLETRVGLILGLANLAADGISMGASNYLGLKSQLEQRGESVHAEQPWRHGLATVIAFAAAGFIPLLGYLLPLPSAITVFHATLFLSFVTLAAAGAARAPFVGKPWWRCAAEMLAVGAVAGGAAYGIGGVVEALTAERSSI